jgi:glycosyltransferase involved in cell wall biosynthesis
MRAEPKAIRVFYAVDDCFPPWRVDLVELFGRQLRDRGVLVEWSFRRGMAGPSERLRFEGQVAHVPHGFGRGNMRDKLLSLLAAGLSDFALFFSWLAGPRFDVLQVRDRRYLAAFLAWIAARITGARFVYWLSYPFPENWLEKAEFCTGFARRVALARGTVSRWYVYRFVMPRADHVFVQSDQMLEDVLAYGVPREKMTPVPMGVAPQMIPRVSPDDLLPARGRVIYMGTLIRVRRIGTLIEAFAVVRKRVPQASLVVVGEGEVPEEREELEALARRLGLQDCVRFTGFLPMVQAWRWAASAEVCVSPLYPSLVLRSSSPTKLLEYMALGKPVVANDHPDQSRVISESGAGLCVPWGVETFAGAIAHLLEHPDVAREMGARGPGWVMRHRSYESLAGMAMEEYRSLLGRG